MEKKLLNEIKRMQQLAGLKPIDEKFVPIESVKLFCENKITEKEFLAELNSELLEEGIWDWIKSNIIDKVMNYFNSFLLQAYSIGWAILNKIKTFLNWLSGLVSKFAKKYPFIFKLIIIGLIILILICVFCATAKAAATGTPIPKDQINIALGYVDSYRQLLDMHDIDFNFKNELTMKVTKALVDLRDGKVQSLDSFSNDVKEIANFALDKTHGLSTQSTDPSLDSESQQKAKDLLLKYLSQGQNVINVTFNKAPESENFSQLNNMVINYKDAPPIR